MLNNNKFEIRNATFADLGCLLELEKEWPEHARASEAELTLRLEKFSAGFFVAADKTGMIASIIAHPYYYNKEDLSLYRTWSDIVKKCYQENANDEETNAIYIVSGTTKKTPYVTELFNAGIHLVIDLAKQMNKRYVVAGALLPGYAKYKKNNKDVSAYSYACTHVQGKLIDPLLEKYRRLGFVVPDERHVIANYFADENSQGYSALVVKDITN